MRDGGNAVFEIPFLVNSFRRSANEFIFEYETASSDILANVAPPFIINCLVCTPLELSDRSTARANSISSVMPLLVFVGFIILDLYKHLYIFFFKFTTASRLLLNFLLDGFGEFVE
jgi:hypothetical protein